MPYRRTFLHTSTHKNASTYRHFRSSSAPKIEMTEGPLFGKILRFVFPLMLTNLLQVFYNAADMVIVSFSNEADAVGSIGLTGAFVNLILNILLGAATGANVVIARHLGAKDDKKTSLAVHTAIFLSFILGFIALSVGVIISKPILGLMGAEGNLLKLATRYTVIYFLGAPFISATNYFIAVFRAKGDTKTPLAILSVSGLCNVILNLVFVLYFELSVEGVAIATTISNILSTVLLCNSLSKDDTACKFSFKKLKIDGVELKEILRLGIPASIQGSLFSISNILVQSSVLQLNNMLSPIGSTFAPVVKGNAVVSNLEGFIYTAQNTVYQAAISFTSQNIGAKKHERVYKIMRNCYLVGFIIAVIVSLIIFAFRVPLLSFYGIKNGVEGSLDALAFETATIKMIHMVLPYFFVSLMEVGCGVVRGLGKAISSTIISLFGACGLRILWIYTVFKIWPTREVLYTSYPISWGVTAIIFFVYVIITLRKMIKQRDMS